jgi:two-component system response regulator DesR
MEPLPGSNYRIVIADDDALMLKLLVTLLSPQYEIVASVHNGEDALAVVDSLKPDALVMDIVMPGLNGIDAARRLHKWGSRTKVVLVTSLGNGELVNEAIAAGARGFVFKSRIFSDLRFAVSEVLAERTFISTDL